MRIAGYPLSSYIFFKRRERLRGLEVWNEAESIMKQALGVPNSNSNNAEYSANGRTCATCYHRGVTLVRGLINDHRGFAFPKYYHTLSLTLNTNELSKQKTLRVPHLFSLVSRQRRSSKSPGMLAAWGLTLVDAATRVQCPRHSHPAQ